MAASGIDKETNLRRSLMDRLISASINEDMPAKTARLERWRAMGGVKPGFTDGARGIEAQDR